MATLKAIPDASTMITTFTQMATTQSNSDTAQDGGAVGYVTRSVPPTAVSDALFGSPHQANDLIGPVRADDGYYILLYHDKRPAPEDRVKAIQDALAQPGADFNTVASQLDEGPEKADGGEIGWFTQDQLSQYSTDLATTVFGLNVGQISDPVEVGGGQYIIKLEEKTVRALDPDQKTTLRPTAFSDWYTPQKDAALANGTIVISDSTTSLGN
jgi:parvulin-like peptidyl-prolyl isomerase